jgi:hypothetical protein
MATKIQVRRDSSADWTSFNPTLSEGEIGYETNTGKFKIGNGSSLWSALEYFDVEVDLSGYLTLVSASTTYLTQDSASTTYLTQDSASTTYLTATTPQTVLSTISSNYTLALSDTNDFIPLSSSAPFTITVPADNTVNFPVGSRIDMVQLGTGQITVSGQTNGDQTSIIRSTPGSKFRTQYSGVSLIKISTNLWSLVGDLSA